LDCQPSGLHLRAAYTPNSPPGESLRRDLPKISSSKFYTALSELDLKQYRLK
jgi:hypothetical protein